MMRSNTRDAARRAFLMISRGLFKRADDDKKMQEVDVSLLHDEAHTKLERFQNFGFTSVPLAPDEDGKGAEVIVVFPNGNRSHGVVIALDDRRHRPKSLKPGESAQYDDQGQVWQAKRDGWYGTAKKWVLGLKDDQNTKVTIEPGKITAQVNGLLVMIRPHRIDLGKEDAPHAIMTEDGPSEKIFGVISESAAS